MVRALEAALDRAMLDQTARVVALVSPGGTGRSTALERFEERAVERGVLAVRVRLGPQGGFPGAALDALVRARLGLRPDATSAQAAQALAGVQADPQGREFLLALLGQLAPGAALAGLDEATRREGSVAELERWLLASGQPAVLLFDDAQHLDEVSWAALELFVTRQAEGAALVVLALRAEEVPAWLTPRLARLVAAGRGAEVRRDGLPDEVLAREFPPEVVRGARGRPLLARFLQRGGASAASPDAPWREAEAGLDAVAAHAVRLVRLAGGRLPVEALDAVVGPGVPAAVAALVEAGLADAGATRRFPAGEVVARALEGLPTLPAEAAFEAWLALVDWAAAAVATVATPERAAGAAAKAGAEPPGGAAVGSAGAAERTTLASPARPDSSGGSASWGAGAAPVAGEGASVVPGAAGHPGALPVTAWGAGAAPAAGEGAAAVPGALPATAWSAGAAPVVGDDSAGRPAVPGEGSNLSAVPATAWSAGAAPVVGDDSAGRPAVPGEGSNLSAVPATAWGAGASPVVGEVSGGRHAVPGEGSSLGAVPATAWRAGASPVVGDVRGGRPGVPGAGSNPSAVPATARSGWPSAAAGEGGAAGSTGPGAAGGPGAFPETAWEAGAPPAAGEGSGGSGAASAAESSPGAAPPTSSRAGVSPEAVAAGGGDSTALGAAACAANSGAGSAPSEAAVASSSAEHVGPWLDAVAPAPGAVSGGAFLFDASGRASARGAHEEATAGAVGPAESPALPDVQGAGPSAGAAPPAVPGGWPAASAAEGAAASGATGAWAASAAPAIEAMPEGAAAFASVGMFASEPGAQAPAPPRSAQVLRDRAWFLLPLLARGLEALGEPARASLAWEAVHRLTGQPDALARAAVSAVGVRRLVLARRLAEERVVKGQVREGLADAIAAQRAAHGAATTEPGLLQAWLFPPGVDPLEVWSHLSADEALVALELARAEASSSLGQVPETRAAFTALGERLERLSGAAVPSLWLRWAKTWSWFLAEIAADGAGARRVCEAVRQRLGPDVVAADFHAPAFLRAEQVAFARGGDPLVARALADSLVGLARARGDRREECLAWNARGLLAFRDADLREARACFEASLSLARQVGFKRREAIALHNLGLVLFQLAEYGAALACQEKYLALSETIGNRVARAYAPCAMAAVHVQRLERGPAEACLLRARAAAEEGAWPSLLAWSRLLSGQLRLHAHLQASDALQLSRARNDLMACLDLVEERGLAWAEELDPAECYVTLAFAYRLSGQGAPARAVLARATPYGAQSPISAKWLEAAADTLAGRWPTATLAWFEDRGFRRVVDLLHHVLHALKLSPEAG